MVLMIFIPDFTCLKIFLSFCWNWYVGYFCCCCFVFLCLVLFCFLLIFFVLFLLLFLFVSVFVFHMTNKIRLSSIVNIFLLQVFQQTLHFRPQCLQPSQLWMLEGKMLFNVYSNGNMVYVNGKIVFVAVCLETGSQWEILCFVMN